MRQTVRILKASGELIDFTVRELADEAEVPVATVHTVLKRHAEWFTNVDRRTTGKRGGQPKVFVLSEAGASALNDLSVIDSVQLDYLSSRLGLIENVLTSYLSSETPLAQADLDRIGAVLETEFAVDTLASLLERERAVLDVRLECVRFLLTIAPRREASSNPAVLVSIQEKWSELSQRLSDAGLETLRSRIRRGLATLPQNTVEIDLRGESPETREPRYGIGVELLPYLARIAVVNDRGDTVVQNDIKLDDMSVGSVITALDDQLDPLLYDRFGSSRTDIPLCLELGGPVLPQAGLVEFFGRIDPASITSAFDPWRYVPLAQLLQHRLQRPCYLENDAHALATYENWKGFGRRGSDFVLLLMREGIGGAAVERGLVVSSPVEVGQIKIWVKGEAETGEVEGTIESLGGVSAIVNRLNSLRSGQPRLATVSESLKWISEQSSRSNGKYTECFESAGQAIAKAIAVMVLFYRPAGIIVYCPEGLATSDHEAAIAFRLACDKFKHEVVFDFYSERSGSPRFIADRLQGAEGAGFVALERSYGLFPALNEQPIESAR